MMSIINVKYKIGPKTSNQAACHLFIGMNVHHRNRKKKKIEQEPPKFLHPDLVAHKSELNTQLATARKPKTDPYCYGRRTQIHLLLASDLHTCTSALVQS